MDDVRRIVRKVREIPLDRWAVDHTRITSTDYGTGFFVAAGEGGGQVRLACILGSSGAREPEFFRIYTLHIDDELVEEVSDQHIGLFGRNELVATYKAVARHLRSEQARLYESQQATERAKEQQVAEERNDRLLKRL